MRSLFVMDPLEKINIAGDSTYVTMRECTDRGYDVLMCTPDDLFSRNGRCFAHAKRVVTTAAAPYFVTEAPKDLDLGDVDVVWMRKDPPFHMGYIFSTYLLEMVPPHVLVVNDPVGLKRFNEKLWVQQQWPQYQPATLLSNNVERVRAFIGTLDRAVLKPWGWERWAGRLGHRQERQQLVVDDRAVDRGWKDLLHHPGVPARCGAW